MACSACKSKRGEGYIEPNALDSPPFKATDIYVYESSEVRRFSSSDWDNDRHKLVLFFPEVFTPVCESEMGVLNDWIEKFSEQNVDVFAATTDPIHAVKEWYETEESLKNPKYRVLSSYLLPARLRVLNGGRAKRASVFITKDGDVVVQEHFLKVGRSLKELHRMIYGYNTDSYCAEGWEDPTDGFLVNKNDNTQTE